MSETTGRQIGDYEILGVLGAGGMGKVFKVRNVISDRIEAMKVLLPDLAGREDLAGRFLREIKVLAALDHPNIAALRTALTLQNQLVMIMEYVEGTTLEDVLTKGQIPAREAVNYVDQVLDALSYAHRKNVIHRDIKPANMMLTPGGVIKLMDFGIARSGDERTLTMTGTTLGSVYYMSPEQVKGAPLDARSDLYSLGVSLYEMVTGERPFRADSDYSLMAAQVQQQPKPPIEVRSDLPPLLNDVILTVMAKDPQQRFQSADAFRRALRSVHDQASPAPAIPGAAAAPLSATAVLQGPSASGPMPAIAPAEPHTPPVSEQPQEHVPSVLEMSKQKSHRGLYMALGALVVTAVLVAAALIPGGSKAATLVSISLTSDNSTASIGTPQYFVATGTYNDGTKKNVTLQSTWASSNTAVATVVSPSQNPERADCLTAGTGVISASMGSVSSSAILTCAAPIGGGQGTVTGGGPGTGTAGGQGTGTGGGEGTGTAGGQGTGTAGGQGTGTAGGQGRGTGGGHGTGTAGGQGTGIAGGEGTGTGGGPGTGTAGGGGPTPPDQSEQLQKLEEEVDQLSSRATSINASLDNMQRQQSADGFALRGDMASAQEMMKTYLAKAQSALQNQDLKGAERYLQLAEPQVKKLEKFLGR